MQAPLPLHYGTANALAPGAGVVRPALLGVGVLHAVAAAGAVAPGVIVRWFGLDAGRWSLLFPQTTEVIIATTAVFSASVLFAAACLAALLRPAGAAARWVVTAAFAYVGVWLVDGLTSGIFPLVTHTIRRRPPALTWLNFAAATGESLCREIGQVSLVLLILYAFGRRRPSDARVLRAIPPATIGVCALQVLMRVFQTLDLYASRYTPLRWRLRVSLLLRDEALHQYWIVGVSYLLVCLLALGTFRRRPRLAGALILIPFLVVEPIARGTLWTAFNVTGAAERAMTLTYDLAFLVFSATTPIAAFVLFTILGRKLPSEAPMQWS